MQGGGPGHHVRARVRHQVGEGPLHLVHARHGRACGAARAPGWRRLTRGAQGLCLKCKFSLKYTKLGYQCAPDVSQCGEDPNANGDGSEEAPEGVGVPKGAEWNQGLVGALRESAPPLRSRAAARAQLCSHLAPKFTATLAADVLEAEEPTIAFTKMCVDVLGEVCTPECRTLSELYENAANPGMEVSGRPGNVGKNALVPYGTDGMAFNVPINQCACRRAVAPPEPAV